MYYPRLSLRVEPMSIKGRFFLFSRNPPLVMMVDTIVPVVLNMIEQQADPSEARASFARTMAAKGISLEAAEAKFDGVIATLSAAGLTLGAPTVSPKPTVTSTPTR